MIEPPFIRESLLLGCLLFSLSTNETVKSEEHNRIPEMFDYGSFVQKFGKVHGPIELASKARLFLGRTLKIFQHNVLYMQKNVSYYLNQNEFTDMLASELENNYVNGDSDLKLVDEALITPDLPANKVEHCNSDPKDGSCNLKEQQEANPNRQPILNFLQDQRVGDLKGTLNQIRELPEIAEEVAYLVELDKDEGRFVNEEWKQNENIISRKSIVDSNNLNYDHDIATSNGVFDEYPETMNKYYVNDIADDYVIVDEDDLHWPTFKGDSSLSLLDSIKSVYNYLTSPTEEDIEALKSFERAQKRLTAHENKPRSAQKGLVYRIDWRETGCITKPSSQKDCNSCYAFATLSLMEFFYCRQKNESTEFSVQYVVDCGSNYELNGCRGGKISGAGLFIKERGIELDTIYPYNGRENQCIYGNEASRKSEGYLRPKITAWQKFTHMGAWQKWLIKSPLIVGISMPADFLAYGGGIHDGLDCSSNITHAMLLVGDGVEKGVDFWLLKNSFADSWGESGYFRLAKSAPLRCFNSAVVARANFKVVSV